MEEHPGLASGAPPAGQKESPRGEVTLGLCEREFRRIEDVLRRITTSREI
jgi:hypothetical protein